MFSRGYDVSIGKIGTLEVDFVAVNGKEKIYIQVSATILDASTRNRELKPLLDIPDNYPKYILTMDQTIYDNFSGIKIKNTINFLLE